VPVLRSRGQLAGAVEGRPSLAAGAHGNALESYLNNFNVLELVCGPVVVSEATLARAVTQPGKILVPQAAAQSGAPPPADGDAEGAPYHPTRK